MITGKTVLFFVLSIITGIVIYKIFKWLDARYPHTRRIPIIGLASSHLNIWQRNTSA